MESNNKSAMTFGFVGNVRLVAQLACVIYDEVDGTVVHGHGASVSKAARCRTRMPFSSERLNSPASRGTSARGASGP